METATTPPPGQPDPDTSEVRLALALNGGVSLAVWMGGCAVELDCARRAYRRSQEEEYGGVYQVLSRVFSRELVVDIMSGSSAGGINGALLAAASVAGVPLHPDTLREKWIGLGNFSDLLQPLSNANPRAILQGDYFHEQLLDTFKELLGSGDDTAGAPHEPTREDERPPPVLNVTTTDLTGTELEFLDTWNEPITASRYQACFRFRATGDYTAANLAGAARASASFPFAFEPWHVKDDELCRLADFDKPRWVIDGGLLDNAPIRLALEAIPSRPAVREVQRFICYVNAEPVELLRDPGADEPELGKLAAAVVNLPRKAPFAAELEDLQHASRRSRLNQHAELRLLDVERAPLLATAESLLPAYRRTRRERSLLDILPNPGHADLAFERIETEHAELPWIPTSLAVPTPGRWGWGITTALRIQQLVLDLIGRALAGSTKDDARTALLTARTEIDKLAGGIRKRRDEFVADPCVVRRIEALANPGSTVAEELAALRAYESARERPIYESVRATAASAFRVADLLRTGDTVVGAALFGGAAARSCSWRRRRRRGRDLPDTAMTAFLERVLSIEVLRRAFSADYEVDTGRPIEFAQLTPYAPTPLFTETPFSAPPPMTPEMKLTGLLLGHFGGFYRGSWRANDFMWGRLDAAARVVALLVGRGTTRVSSADAGEIAKQLMKSATGQEKLIEGALADAGIEVGAGRDLQRTLASAIEADLAPRDGGALTRVLCTLAAQIEIVKVELPVVVREAKKDEKTGSSPNELDLPAEDELPARLGDAIASLRRGDPLPVRLGVHRRDEETSDLAARTVSRTALVLLAILGNRAPFATPLQLARTALLPISGTVARKWPSRLLAGLAFWSAAVFLAGQFVTTKEGRTADLGKLDWPPVAMTLVAVVVVLSTAALPLFRFFRLGKWRKLTQAFWVLLLVGAGFGVGAVLAIVVGDLSPGKLIVQRVDEHRSDLLLAPALVVAGAGAGLSISPWLRRIVGRVTGPTWSPALALLTFVAVAGVVVRAWPTVTHHFASGADWRRWTARTGLIGAPVVAALYLFVRTPLDRFIEHAQENARRAWRKWRAALEAARKTS